MMWFEDGSVFDGQWSAGQRFKGKHVAADGSWEYSGDYKDDLQHGTGVFFRVRSWRRGLQAWQGWHEGDGYAPMLPCSHACPLCPCSVGSSSTRGSGRRASSTARASASTPMEACTTGSGARERGRVGRSVRLVAGLFVRWIYSNLTIFG